jgi:MFS family permease
VFLKPLIQEFHSGRGAVSLAFTLHNAILALCLPFAGRLIDRFGARKVILPSLFMVGLILLSAYFCSGRIWQLYLLYLGLGIAGCGAAPVSYCAVISHWFDRHRGLALGFMMAGLGAGAVAMPSAAQYLIPRFGWRVTFGIVGAAILVFTVPVVTMFLKERPERLGLLPDGSPDAYGASAGPDYDLGLSWREAWRTPTFWLLFGVSSSFRPACKDISPISRPFSPIGEPLRKLPPSSLFGGGLLAGRAGSGYLLDRFFAPRVAAFIFGCAAAGIGLLRIAGSAGLAFAAAFLIGIGLGAEVDIMAYLTGRYFGLRSFGTIYGFTFAGFGMAGGLGAYMMGAAFDATGSYKLALALFCIVTLIGAALLIRLGPYRYRIRRPDESSAGVEMLRAES